MLAGCAAGYRIHGGTSVRPIGPSAPTGAHGASETDQARHAASGLPVGEPFGEVGPPIGIIAEHRYGAFKVPRNSFHRKRRGALGPAQNRIG